jgi:hypothetical protein
MQCSKIALYSITSSARASSVGGISRPIARAVGAFLVGHRAVVTSLAARYRLPAIYFYRVFAEIGGLASYGNDSVDNYRRSAPPSFHVLRCSVGIQSALDWTR